MAQTADQSAQTGEKVDWKMVKQNEGPFDFNGSSGLSLQIQNFINDNKCIK